MEGCSIFKSLKDKNSKTFKFINFIIGISIIVVIIYLILIFLKFLVGITKNLDAVVIVALLTGTVSILGIISGKICEYKYKIKQHKYEKKEVIYSSFIDFYYDILLSKELNVILESMRKFSNNLMIHGSHKVIKKWSVILTKSRQGVYSNDPNQILFDTEEVFFEIRKDLGDKYNFKKGDLLQLEIKDVHNIL